jgi:hypothetical protein
VGVLGMSGAADTTHAQKAAGRWQQLGVSRLQWVY